MDKSPDAFRTISEVAEWLGVQAHVLRFWESKFSQIKPVKRAGGRRYYRPTDMVLLGGIKKLLHDDGLTVKGVQKILNSEGVEHVSGLSPELCDVAKDTALKMAAEPDAASTVVPFTSAQSEQSTPTEVTKSSSNVEAVAEDTPVEADSVPGPEIEPVAEAGADPVTEKEVVAAAPLPPAGAELELETKVEQEPEATPDSDPKMDLRSDQIIAPPPDAPTVSSDSPPTEEKPILPSFLHRPAPQGLPESKPDSGSETRPKLPAAEQTTPESAPESKMASSSDTGQVPERDAPRIPVIDAPDPPNEDEIPYSQGPLAHLATLDALSAAQIAEIAPLAEELKAWLSKSAGSAAP